MGCAGLREDPIRLEQYLDIRPTLGKKAVQYPEPNFISQGRRRRELLARFLARSPDVARQGPGVLEPGGLEPGALRAALASLRDDDQEILRLVAWDGLATAQLALVLGCSPSAARTRLHRARSRLAARLGIGPDLQRYARAGHKQGDGIDSVEVS